MVERDKVDLSLRTIPKIVKKLELAAAFTESAGAQLELGSEQRFEAKMLAALNELASARGELDKILGVIGKDAQ